MKLSQKLTEWISNKKKERLQIAKIRIKERHKQTLQTALYKEQVRGKRARRRADFDFWQSLAKDLSKPHKHRTLSEVDYMVFGKPIKRKTPRDYAHRGLK